MIKDPATRNYLKTQQLFKNNLAYQKYFICHLFECHLIETSTVLNVT
jgi:hypothetical protein